MDGTKVFRSYNDWVNQSIQICRICGKTRFEPQNTCSLFYRHVKDCHGLTNGEYTVKYGSRWCKKAKHQCRICQKSIVLYHSNFNIHTTTHHNLKSIEYFFKYVKGQPVQDDADVISSGDAGVQIMPEKEATDPDQFNDWINQCVQECKICSISISCSDLNMCNHLRKMHKMTKDQYIEKYQSVYSIKVNHRCLLCGKNVWLQIGRMKSHLHYTHKMKPETYFKNHVIGREPTDNLTGAVNSELKLKPKRIVKKMISKPRQQVKQLKGKPQAPSLTAKIKGKHRIHQCKICQSEILCDLVTLKDHFQDHHSMILEEYFNCYLEDYSCKVNKWASRRIYPCQKCEQKFLSSQAFLGHMESAHSIRTVTQKEANDLIGSHKTFHKCLICGKPMVHKEMAITNHLKKFHNIVNLNLYYQIFVKSVKRTEVTKPPVLDEFLNPDFDQLMLEPTPNQVDERVGMVQNGNLASQGTETIQIAVRPLTPPLKVSREVQRVKKLNKDDQDSKDNVKLDIQAKDELGLQTVEDIKPDPDDFGPELDGQRLDGQKFDEDWMNRCQFYCPLCEQEHYKILDFKCMVEFEQHASEDHSMTYLQFLKSVGDPCASPEFFNCKLCTKSLLHDKKMITNHLKVHSITPSDYKELYLN